ncbi:uncharacterized protein F4822DRAFT_298852 [Hypoxylon trugodes]|uniref:uncharacterized protein n=1 Tax=Hypoxylon trugodes TaxID=326681 RepID=UPI0021968684|nr:uncharacterized protein F4822DRAFT_298852 [Hypoxylon trugodes]KAI1387995.1 hypothetical protein F4822DRAFT_298852 [Hypoxylon trugodes]
MAEIDPALESRRPEERDNAINTQEQHQSGTIDGQDGSAPVYNNSPLDQPQEQTQMQEQEHIEHAEPTSPHLRNTHPSITSAEELQLAAQLSQDLSQGMPSAPIESVEESNLRNAMAQSEANESQLQQVPQSPPPPPPHEQQQQHEQHDQLQPGQASEPSNHIHEQHEQQHHSHELSELPSELPEEQHHAHEHLAHSDHPVDSREIPIAHHEQPLHHDQQPQHHYLAEQHQQDHPLHLAPQQSHPQQQHQHQPHFQSPSAVEQLAQHFAAQASAMPDNIPPRKRSKVSRACDECRRKKVKCDAVSENGDEPCSNCRRSSIRCLFSRIPQKRGPSKGYIKELADRINSIEGKLASEGGNVDLNELLNGARRESADMFGSPGQPEENGRKRPYSSISGGEFTTPTSSRQATWSSEPRPIQPYQTPTGTGAYRAPYPVNGLAPQPLSKPDAVSTPQPPAAAEPEPLDLNQNGQIRELNDDAFSGYLNVVHTSFPLLAESKARVEGQLSQCPSLLRDAFIEALYGTMQSFVSIPGLYTNVDIGSATRMITEWESDTTPRTMVMNLVHLQTLILTAIGTDNYGPASLKGEHGGPSKASMLGRAVGLAYSMRLHVSSVEMAVDAQLEPDSNENIAIRVWWSLVMLDRWNAISTANPLFIPNDSVVIMPSLNLVLGDNVYHLARLSNILGHFAPVCLISPKVLSPDSGAAPILSSLFNLSIELFREVLPQGISPESHPILHMVYWHCRMLAYLFQTNAKSTDVLWPCKEIANILFTKTQLLSPLNHHFFCLTTLSLVELAKIEKTRDEATNLLRQLFESNVAPSTWDSVIRDCISEHIRPSTAQAAANQSLQHLADLATATEINISKSGSSDPATLRTSDNYNDLGFDPRRLTRGGYLNVLAEVHASTTR